MITIVCCACGGGGSDTGAHTPATSPLPSSAPTTAPVVQGSAPGAAGWSDVSTLTNVAVNTMVISRPTVTLDNSGGAIVSGNGLPDALNSFQSVAPSTSWTSIPDAPLKYSTSLFGHRLVNNRLNAMLVAEDKSLVEATYDAAWITRTIAPAQNSNSTPDAKKIVTAATGQRAIFWDEFPSGRPTHYFSAARPGNSNWDSPTEAPQWASDGGDGNAIFLASGELMVAMAVDNTTGTTPFYGDSLHAYIYDNGRWNSPTPLYAPSVLQNKVACAVIAPLDARRFAMAWLEKSPIAGSTESSYTILFSYFDGTTRLTTPQDLLFATGMAYISNVGPECPYLNATANGDLTFTWHRGTIFVARRFSNGSFNNAASIPSQTAASGGTLVGGAFDGAGNFRFIATGANQIFTAEFKADQGVWSDVVPLWEGTSRGSAIAVNARGDAVVTWMTYNSTPLQGRSESATLMARRFTH